MFQVRIFTQTEHNVRFPYFGWKSCWLMAALPAGEWLFKIILEARKRKSSNNGLMSDEPGIEHNIHVEDEHIVIQRFCLALSYQSSKVKGTQGHPTAEHSIYFNA